MPGRLLPLVNDEIYHVFNRGIDRRPTFTDKWEYKRALLVTQFYRFADPPAKLSAFLKIPPEDKEKIMSELQSKGKKLVEIIAFCLMPNHFHFLLKQVTDNGISKFMSNFQNSYTRYFNTRHERIGPLFLDQFKAVRITSDEQLLHSTRYVHLNPHTSFVIKDLDGLIQYPWSSFQEYLGISKDVFCDKEMVLSMFKSKETYQQFVFDQADYQRELHQIEHLLLEDKR